MQRKFIYSLTRQADLGWDEVVGMVIIARSITEARSIAANNHEAEGKTTWMKEADVTKIGYAAKGQKVCIVCKRMG